MSSLHSISCILPSDLEAELSTIELSTDPAAIYELSQRLLHRLQLRKKKFGPCPQVLRQVELTVVALNMLACRTLRHADQATETNTALIHENALKMLGQAGELCGGSDDALAVDWFQNERKRLLVQTTTLNNCACVLRKTNDLEGALNCLFAALELENQILDLNEKEGYDVLLEEQSLAPPLPSSNDLESSNSVTSTNSVQSSRSTASFNSAGSVSSVSSVSSGTVIQAPRSNPAGTHLNLCAVLSKLKRHDEAMIHATSALSLIHNGKSPTIASDGAGNKSSVRAIGHYNLGVEQESLGLLTAAEGSYQSAMAVCTLDLGSNHSLTVSIRNNSYAGLKAIEKRKTRRKKKNDLKKKKNRENMESGEKIGPDTQRKKKTRNSKTSRTKKIKNTVLLHPSKKQHPMDRQKMLQKKKKKKGNNTSNLSKKTKKRRPQSATMARNVHGIVPPPVAPSSPSSFVPPPRKNPGDQSAPQSTRHQQRPRPKSATIKQRRPLRDVANARNHQHNQQYQHYQHQEHPQHSQHLQHNTTVVSQQHLTAIPDVSGEETFFESFLGDRSTFSQRAPKMPRILRPNAILNSKPSSGLLPSGTVEEEVDGLCPMVGHHNLNNFNSAPAALKFEIKHIEPQDKLLPPKKNNKNNGHPSVPQSTTQSAQSTQQSFARRQHQAKRRQQKRKKKTTSFSHRPVSAPQKRNHSTAKQNTANHVQHQRMIVWAKQYDGAVKIQRLARGWVGRKAIQQQLPVLQRAREERFAATTIQQCVRAANRHKQERQHRQLTKAVLQLQTRQRKHQACLAVSKRWQRQQQQLEWNAALVLQRHVRTTHARCKAREFCQKYNRAAVTLQRRLYHGVAKPSMVRRATRYLKNTASTVICMVLRRHSTGKKIQARRQKKQLAKAATTIQLALRWHCIVAKRIQSHTNENLRVQNIVVVQTLQRGRKARALYKQKKMIVASTVALQTWFRCRCARNKFGLLLQDYREHLQQTRCVVLQCWWRGVVAQTQMQRYKHEHLSCQRLQCVVRGYLGRKNYQQLKQLHRLKRQKEMELQRLTATMAVQCVYRGYCVRRRWKRQLKSVVIIACAWRVHLAKHALVRALRCKMSNKLQRWAIDAMARKSKRRQDASKEIQTVARGWLKRQRALLAMNAAVRIQAMSRVALAKKRFCKRKMEEFASGGGDGGSGHCSHGTWDGTGDAGLHGAKEHSMNTFDAFSTSGMSLSSTVLEAVQRAEKIAKQIEYELMGIGREVVDRVEAAEKVNGNGEGDDSLHARLLKQMERSEARFV